MAITASVHSTLQQQLPWLKLTAAATDAPLLQAKPDNNLDSSQHNARLLLVTGTTHNKEPAVRRWSGSPQTLDPQGEACAVSGLAAPAAGTA